jgi:hypothetical protein
MGLECAGGSAMGAARNLAAGRGARRGRELAVSAKGKAAARDVGGRQARVEGRSEGQLSSKATGASVNPQPRHTAPLVSLLSLARS